MGEILQKLKDNIVAAAQKKEADDAQCTALFNEAEAKVRVWLAEHGVTEDEFTITFASQLSYHPSDPFRVDTVKVSIVPKGYEWAAGGFDHAAVGFAFFDDQGEMSDKRLLELLDALVVPESWVAIQPEPEPTPPSAPPAPTPASIEQRFVSTLVELLESYGYRIEAE